MVGPKYLKSNKVSSNVGYLVYLLLNSPNLLNKSRLQRNRRLVRVQVPLVEQTSMEKRKQYRNILIKSLGDTSVLTGHLKEANIVVVKEN